MRHLVCLLLLFVSPLLGKIYWGVWDTEFNKEDLSVQKIVRDVDRKPSIVMSYLKVGDNLSQKRLLATRGEGAIPMVTVEPQREGELTQIANGNKDAWIADFARQIKNYGHPIFIRFAHEMNAAWYPWASSKYPAGTYKKAWNHFFQQLKKHNANKVTSVWCPNAENDLRQGGTITATFESVWPDAESVDWLCLDGYTKGASKKTFTETFAPSIAHLNKLAPGKPIMIGETGVTEKPGNPSFKVEWITQAFKAIPKMDIQAFLWFNENKDASTVEYDTTQAARAAFKAGINSGYFTAGQFSNLEVNEIPIFEKLPAKAFAVAANDVNSVDVQQQQTLLGLPVGAGTAALVGIIVGSSIAIGLVVAFVANRKSREESV